MVTTKKIISFFVGKHGSPLEFSKYATAVYSADFTAGRDGCVETTGAQTARNLPSSLIRNQR
jgi:hypothetical protein